MSDDFKAVLNLLTEKLVNIKNVNLKADEKGIPILLNTAFLQSLVENYSQKPGRSVEFLYKMQESKQYGYIADFYLKGLECIKEEVAKAIQDNEILHNRLKALAQWINEGKHDIHDQATIETGLVSFFSLKGVGFLLEKTKPYNT